MKAKINKMRKGRNLVYNSKKFIMTGRSLQLVAYVSQCKYDKLPKKE